MAGKVVATTNPAQANLGAVRGRIVSALFPRRRAVLIERRSALSHSVSLLRELGMPTISNVPGLTQHLRTCAVGPSRRAHG